MRDFDQPTRASGPGVVVDGPAGARTVLVIDPAGEGVHDGIPATWRELAKSVRIVWLRVPAAPEWKSTVDTVLERHDGDNEPVPLDVVSSGPIAGAVIDLVRHHENLVHSVLLVDPEIDVDVSFARVIARSDDTSDGRVPPPLTLGHPDVVAAVTARLR